MSFYLKSIDFDMWELIEEGYVEPIAERKNWIAADKKRASLDAKGVTLLFCALSPEEFNRVSNCKTAREIWTTLETTHDGTTQVKKSKVNMLISDFESFEIYENESIFDMFTHFTNVVNELSALGKTYINYELVQRLLRCFPDNWDPIITAIEQSKDLDTLRLDDLMGNLNTNEMKMKKREGKGQGKKEETMKRGAAFKAKVDSEEDESDQESNLKDLTKALDLLTKKKNKCRRLNQNNRYARRSNSPRRQEDDDSVQCYECGKARHFCPECPYLKKDKTRRKRKEDKKKKSFSANWDGLSDSSKNNSSDDEKSNFVCYMASDPS
ncbi:uncharacterized protein LOC143883016 [Tasmannia lanceolata]|uniref:uncharacterized protein LOC143883016 n=1 Tax=Tasmannia lanceolata TaxID=3420 RepID=UPI004062F4AE